MSDLKAPQMKVQCSLIQELRLYEFNLDPNDTEGSKNISGGKDEDMDNPCKVTWWVKKFRSGFKKIDDQPWLGKEKAVISSAML